MGSKTTAKSTTTNTSKREVETLEERLKRERNEKIHQMVQNIALIDEADKHLKSWGVE